MKTSSIYSMITQLRAKGHAVAGLCRLFEVSQSGYFSSIGRPESARDQRRRDFTQKIIHIYRIHRSRYGRPRIYQTLKAQGEHISESMVGNIMKKEGLRARKKRPFRPQTTQRSSHSRIASNLLKRHQNSQQPNQILVSDITYVATKQGWLYLAAIMDLHTRAIKGYAIEESMPTGLILQALGQVTRHHPKAQGAILHSDRGCQYTSNDYLKELREKGFRASMSATGNCYDNAAMESFWSTLKTECFPQNGVFKTKEQARQAIFEYIEGYYHTERIHSSLGYQTPHQAEQQVA